MSKKAGGGETWRPLVRDKECWTGGKMTDRVETGAERPVVIWVCIYVSLSNSTCPMSRSVIPPLNLQQSKECFSTRQSGRFSGASAGLEPEGSLLSSTV